MLDFIVVQHPPFGPSVCVCCGYGAAPYTDTHRELHGYGRVYVCSLCVKRLAVANGLARGKRMQELLKAGDLLNAAEREIAQRTEAQAAVSANLEDSERLVAELREQLERRDGRIEQLEGRIAEMGRQAVQLVQG